MKVQSHLTRQVFRALIANKPYRAPGCQLRPSPRPSRPHLQPFHASKKQRSFFNLLGESYKTLEGAQPTPQNVERALSQLVEVVRSRRIQSRPPSDAKIVDALRFLFSIHADNAKDLTRSDVFLITQALQHLSDQDAVLNDDLDATITLQDLQNLSAALALHWKGDFFRTDARRLAELIYQIMRDHPGYMDNDIWGSYIAVIARAGDIEEASKLLRNALTLDQEELMRLWVTVLKCERRPVEFQKILQEIQQRLGPLSPEAHEDLVSHVTARGNIGLSNDLLTIKLQRNEPPTTTAVAQVLQLCIEKSQRSLGAYCAGVLQSRNDLRPSLDILLLWFATQSSDTKVLKEQLLMYQEQGLGDAITMQTFNLFIQHAYRNNDPEQAQRYIDLAEFFGLRPDGATHALALDHDLSRNDMNAAASRFEALLNEDVPDDRSDMPVLNKLLQKLTFSPDPPQQVIMRVVDRVLETGADLEADTIAGLCSVFLKSDETEQLGGLVRYRVDAFDAEERARIIAVFKDYILDPSTANQRAWNAYDLVRNGFPEMEVPDRIQLMQNMFERNRPDLACLVFGHMRQRQELEARPTAEAYAQCFFGIAKCKDVDGLQMVYNMLKMDQEVEQTTKVHNALMAAYTACRTPFTAIIDHYWKILDSREGPTLSTFLLALRACEMWIPVGSLEARRIMGLMQKWNMLITKEIYDSYIGAIAGQSEFENAIDLIENMEKDIGEAPDAVTIGTFYNAIPWQYRKDEVERWAKKMYPEQWEVLVSFGDVIDEEWEVRYFKVDREIDTDDELLFKEEPDPQLAQGMRRAIEEPVG